MNTKRFLKSILTTSAVVAAAAAPIYSANATEESTNGAATLSSAANFAGGHGVGLNWNVNYSAAGHTIKIANNGDSIVADLADAPFGINTATNAADPGVIVTQDTTITGANGAGNAINVRIDAAKTVTLSGVASTNVAANTYTKLGTVTFNNVDGTVDVTSTGATFAGAIDTATTHELGTLNIKNANTFTGAIGGTRRLKMVNVSAAAGTTTLGAVDAKQIETGAGAVTFTGAVAVPGTGLGATGDAFKTGAGKVTFSGATVIGSAQGRLNLGGAVEFSDDLTLGVLGGGDATTGEGTLKLITNDKVLRVNSDYAATGNIIVDTGRTLTYKSGAAHTLSAAITAVGNGVEDLTFTANAAGAVTLNKDIGASANKFATVTITGANDGLVLAAGKKIYATTLSFNHAGASLTLNAGSDVVGDIKASAAGNGTLIVKGNSGGTSTTMHTNRFGTLTFDAAADANSTFTVKPANNISIDAINFSKNDDSGLVIDMGNNARTLTTQGTTSTGTGSGSIEFTNNSGVEATLAVNTADVGTKAAPLNKLKATGGGLTIAGSGQAVHVNQISANTLTLNKTDLGLYQIGTGSPTKIVVTANDSSILEGSNYSSSSHNVELNFAANQVLTLAKNVNHTGNVTTTANNQGTLTLTEGNTVTAPSHIGTTASTQQLVAINYGGGASTTATIEAPNINTKALNFTSNAAGAKVILKGNLNGNVANTSGTNNRGILEIQSGNITGSVGVGGGATTMEKVVVNTTGTANIGTGGASTYSTAATDFQADGTLVLNANVAGVGAFGAVTTKTDNTGTIVANQNITTSAAVGSTNALRLKEFRVGSGSTFSVGHAANIATITTDNANTGTVTFTAAAVHDKTSVGTSSARMGTVNVNDSITLDNIFTKEMTVADGKILTAKRVDASSTTGISLAGATAQVSLLDGGYITKTQGNVGATVTAQGSATIAGDLAGNLTLAGGNVSKVVTFEGTKISGAVITDASTLKLGGAAGTTVFNTTLAATGTTLDLGSRVLNVVGNTNFAGSNVIKLGTNADGAIRSDGGTFTAAANSLTLDFSNTGNVPSSLKLFTKTDGATAVAVGGLVDKTAITTQNARTIKSVTYDTKSNAFTIVRNSADELATVGQKSNVNDMSVVSGIAGATSFTGDEIAFVAAMNSATTDAQFEELVGNLVPQTHQTAMDVNAGARSSAMNVANTRMHGTSHAAFASTPAGVAAGDAADRFGLWADAKFGKSEQKERKSVAGYKSSSYGAFVGVDTMLSDRATLGVAFGYDKQNLKHRDSQDGSKTNAGSLSFGAYGSYDFGNNFFTQGNVAVAQTTIDAKVRRGTVGNYTTAKAKYDVLGYGAEVRGGYRFKFDNSVITPTAGLSYSYFGDSSYTETGAAYNLVNKGQSRSNLAAVAGLNLGTALDLDGFDVKPEVHMNLAYDVVAPKQKSRYNFSGGNVKFDYKGSKPARFAYNFGASVMAKTDNIEYGVGYDADLADKYLGHTGSVKVKVSF